MTNSFMLFIDGLIDLITCYMIWKELEVCSSLYEHLVFIFLQEVKLIDFTIQFVCSMICLAS